MSMINQRMAARRKYDAYTSRKVCCYSVSKETTTTISPHVCEPKGKAQGNPPALPPSLGNPPPCPLAPRVLSPLRTFPPSVTNLPLIDIAQRKGSAAKLYPTSTHTEHTLESLYLCYEYIRLTPAADLPPRRLYPNGKVLEGPVGLHLAFVYMIGVDYLRFGWI